MLFATRFLRKRPLARDAGWMLGAQVVRALLQAGYFIFVARALGASGVGVVAASLALIAIVMPFAGWGSGNVLVMRASRTPSVVRQAWGNALLTTVAGSGALVVIATLGSALFLPHVPLALILLLGIAECCFARIAETASQAFQALQRMRTTAIVGVLPSGFRFLASVAFFELVDGGTATDWAKWHLGASIAGAAMAAAVVTLALGKPLFAVRETLENARDGAYFSVALAATTIYTDIDKTMLAQLASLAAAGAYAASYRFVALMFLPITALLLAAYPRYFQHGEEGLAATVGYARRLLRSALPYGVFAGVVVLVGAPLLPSVLGRDFAGAVSILYWLAPLPLLQIVYYFGADALTGAGLQRLRSAIQICAAAANVLLNLWLIPAYGARGAAWSTVVTYAALAAAVWIAARARSHSREGVPDARPGLARG